MMNQIATIRTVAFLVTMAVPAWAGEKLPTFPRKTDYDEARASLIALGWKPVPQSSKRCDRDGCFIRCAGGFENRCKVYPEAEICRGTGLAACEFLWRRGETLIEVRTIGETAPPRVASVRCRANCR